MGVIYFLTEPAWVTKSFNKQAHCAIMKSLGKLGQVRRHSRWLRVVNGRVLSRARAGRSSRACCGAARRASSVTAVSRRRPWVPGSAMGGFTIASLPYGVGAPAGGTDRVVVAIGDYALDLASCAEAGLLTAAPSDAWSSPNLNRFLETGRTTQRAVRDRLQQLLAVWIVRLLGLRFSKWRAKHFKETGGGEEKSVRREPREVFLERGHRVGDLSRI